MESLTYTENYTREVEALQASESPIHGLAHITGGGLLNIARLNSQCDYVVDAFPTLDQVAPIFKELVSRSQLSDAELFKTFNMGVGMCVLTPDPEGVRSLLNSVNVASWTIGKVVEGTGKVWLNGHTLV